MPRKEKTTKSHENYFGLSKYLDSLNRKANGKKTKKELIPFLVVLIITLLITFINFASFEYPNSTFETQIANTSIMYEIPENTQVNSLYINTKKITSGVSKVTVFTSDNYSTAQSNWTMKDTFAVSADYIGRYLDCYKFGGKQANYIILQFSSEEFAINEVVFTDMTDNTIPLNVVYVNSGTISEANKTIDEQDTFRIIHNNKFGMYFDEIYHARTAYEYITGEPIFEWTHPPLGKLIISLGILIFGMNPFGFRIMGALFSIGTVVLMYFLGKKVFKNQKFALALMLLSVFEGLRYTLGRIATVDSFLGFFIVASFYFMYDFFEKGVDVNKIIKSLIPFALAGIFFGLAFSVKWNGAYAGLGLLALLIIYFVRLTKSFIDSKERVNDGEYTNYDKTLVKKYPAIVIGIIISGLIFYVIIPFIIYFLQFSVFIRSGQEGSLLEVFIIQNKAIFDYHTNLSEPHQSASPWWSWIFNGRSVYFALYDSMYGAGVYSRIHCMMTTVTCVYGIWAIIYFVILVIKYLSHKRKQILTTDEVALMNRIKTPLIFFTVGFLSNWIPWAFISRVAYIYHFYASCIFMLGLIVLFLYTKCLLERDIIYSGELAILNGKKKDITRGDSRLYLCICLFVVNFLLFWPAFAGFPIGTIVALFMFGWANGFWGVGLFF